MSLVIRPQQIVSVCAEMLRGYGQILFCGRRRSGLLVLGATLMWPYGGLCGLLGALSAIVTGRVLPQREVLSAPGLYACNGALAGIAIGAFSPQGMALAPLAGALAGAMLFVLSYPCAALRLPPLSLPFVLSTWTLMALLPHAALASPQWGGSAAHALHILGLAVFTWSGAAGVMLVLAVLLHARWQAALLAAALPVAVWTAALATGGSAVVPAAALNMALTLVALTIVFVPGQGAFLGLVGAAAALLFTVVLDPITAGLRLPLLVAPFNAATLVTLFMVRQPVARPRFTIHPPFFGRWTVSQGPNGALTHQGEGRWAWDFVVADDDGRTHRGAGLRLEDYHAWGIPVRAVADGVVACVVDGVEDNVPPRDNPEQEWGNHVIIEHGPGLYSEISHLQCGSITVAPGDRVARGAVIGRCGNSGRSLEPHIHIQLQTGPFAGASSVPARFVGCRVDGRADTTAIPAEGEVMESLD